jgi:hypothetical protein
MEGSFLYILQVRECRRFKESIYKIGRSDQITGRIRSYGNGTQVHMIVKVNDSKKAEKKVIKEFRQCFSQKPFYGTEYFEGNLKLMKILLFNIAMEFHVEENVENEEMNTQDEEVNTQDEEVNTQDEEVNTQDEEVNTQDEEKYSDEIDSDEIDSDEIDSDEIDSDEIDSEEIDSDEIDSEDKEITHDESFDVEEDESLLTEEPIKSDMTFLQITDFIIEFFKNYQFLSFPDKSIRNNEKKFISGSEFLQYLKNNAPCGVERSLRKIGLFKSCVSFIEKDGVIPKGELPVEERHVESNAIEDFVDEYLEQDTQGHVTLKEIKMVIRASNEYIGVLSIGHSCKKIFERVLNTQCLDSKRYDDIKHRNVFCGWKIK